MWYWHKISFLFYLLSTEKYSRANIIVFYFLKNQKVSDLRIGNPPLPIDCFLLLMFLLAPINRIKQR